MRTFHFDQKTVRLAGVCDGGHASSVRDAGLTRRENAHYAVLRKIKNNLGIGEDLDAPGLSEANDRARVASRSDGAAGNDRRIRNSRLAVNGHLTGDGNLTS